MATTKYAWPLPGEAITAKELFAAELMAAIPSLRTYSEDGRLFAILTELISALYNGSQVLAALGVQGPLIVGADPGGPQIVRVGGDLKISGNVTYGLTNLTAVGGTAVTPVGYATNISVSDGANYTVNAPSNFPPAGTPMVVTISNGFGTLGTISWNTSYKFVGASAPTNPASAGKTRLIAFLSFGASLVELYRSAGDI